MTEARYGENMVRVSVDVDLGMLLVASIADPAKRFVLEERIIAFGHDMFEAGQTLGTGDSGEKYMEGFQDGLDVIEEGQGE